MESIDISTANKSSLVAHILLNVASGRALILMMSRNSPSSGGTGKVPKCHHTALKICLGAFDQRRKAGGNSFCRVTGGCLGRSLPCIQGLQLSFSSSTRVMGCNNAA